MPEVIKHQSESVYKLYSGRWARIPFYNELKTHIANRLHLFEAKDKFTLRRLCGEEFWNTIESIHLRRIAGMCFRTMVSEGVFPLAWKRYKRTATKFYEFSR